MKITKSPECGVNKESEFIRNLIGEGWYVKDSDYPNRYYVYSNRFRFKKHLYLNFGLNNKIDVYTKEGLELAIRISAALEEHYQWGEIELILYPPLCDVDIEAIENDN